MIEFRIKLTYLLFFLVSTISAQPCIVNTDLTACARENNFGYVSLQCPGATYEWTLPDGSTALVFNSQKRTILLGASEGSYQVEVTYDDGSPTELRQFEILEDCCFGLLSSGCEDCIGISVEGNTNTPCTGAMAWLQAICQAGVASVEWSWSLNGVAYKEPLGTYGPAETVVVDGWSGDFDNHYIVFYATITYWDGSTCETSQNKLLECGEGDMPILDFRSNGNKTKSSVLRLAPMEINIYPIPTQNTFTIDYNSRKHKIQQVQIVDSRGHISRTYDTRTEQTPSFDIQGLSPGLYVVKIEFTDKSERIGRLIIQ